MSAGAGPVPAPDADAALAAPHDGRPRPFWVGWVPQALDRFAQFFHAPLFNPSCVEREMNAVDEEFRKNISEDGWRVLHVLKELANPVHPFTFFNTGNLDSMKLISQVKPHAPPRGQAAARGWLWRSPHA